MVVDRRQQQESKYGLQQTLSGHSGAVFCVAFSTAGNLMAMGCNNNAAEVWEVRSRTHVHTFEGHSATVFSVAFSPRGRLLATGSGDNTAMLWDLRSRRLVHIFEGHSSWVQSVAFAPSGYRLTTGSYDNTVKMWDARSRKLVASFVNRTSSDAAAPPEECPSDVVHSAHFSAGGDFLATGCGDKTAKIWDVRSMNLVYVFRGHSNQVFAVAFSPAGDLLATGSADKMAKLWDLQELSLVHNFRGHGDWVRSVAFSPSGELLATGSRDKTAKLWDVGARKLLHTLDDHSSIVFSVAFSPAGDALATGSADATVKLWDLGRTSTPSEFFQVFAQAERESWGSTKALERLAATVGDTNELTLLYSAASAAHRHGDVSLDEKRDLVRKVLAKAPIEFRFDRDSRVATALKLIIEKAQEDGLVDRSEALRLDRLLERADAPSDDRFVGLVARLSSMRSDRIADYALDIGWDYPATTAILDYARRVDRELVRFERRARAKGNAAVNILSAIVGAFAAMDMPDGGGGDVFNRVVDFSDTSHVVDAMRQSAASSADATALDLLVSDDNFEACVVGAPLHDAVRQHKMDLQLVQAAALVKTCLVCNNSDEDLETEPPDSSSSSEAVFAALKRDLGCDDDATEIDADVDFAIVVENYFDDLDFEDLGVAVRDRFLAKLKNKNGHVSLYMWKNLCKKWHKSNKPLPDYLASL
ncbi:hypothetical protein CTAYLR_004288 [Chrysophaeum taylorii]|uniref:Uncharacterized protein n=1 Tax=Chrysophaeum taylorii TaxID=2483200 RepID=A0AAD7UDQ5_9STRA|nr:hypothetical protein CTAYLR_004288 [Chrysophaeum taylorii]